MSANNFVALDGKSLTIEAIASIVYKSKKVKISAVAEKNIAKARKKIREILQSGKTVYGINTGFGALSTVSIPDSKVRELQHNLIKSHTAGSGAPLPAVVVKAAMVLIANGLSIGYSGCRLEVVKTLVDMVNKGVLPVVPEQGSLGASGDLIPLAHIAVVVTGDGEAEFNGKRYPGGTAMKKAGIKPLKLEAKEGLSLINGTYFMSALGSLTLRRAEKVCKLTDIAAAITLEVTMGSKIPNKPEIHEIRPHPGQIATAENIRKLVKGSEIIESHKYCSRVQDAYSLRCVPQVHGAVKDALRYARSTLEIELNSVTDNPIVFKDDVISAGNFHGQPLAVTMDTLGIAMTGLGNIIERRIDRLMNPALSGLPAFLSPPELGGLNSGYMMAHYLAASISFENRGLSTPGSIDSVPVSANKEDFNSNGMWCARKAWKIVENTEKITALELLCAVQALEYVEGWKAGKGTQAAYDVIRGKVKKLRKDRIIKKDIDAVIDLIRSDKILDAVEKAAGTLKV
ncbi:histidine ammonia-lyase [candidate division KSB1 bacterium]|nr:histidine ammonia-lyase [candidate division KSB1 bacterium]